MEDNISFRGQAGQVIVGFVKPSSIISAVPVLLFMVVSIGLAVYLIPEGYDAILGLVLLIMISFAVSRFAIPARAGHYQDGWFSAHNSSQESLAFSIRYVVITLSWAIPCTALLWLTGMSSTAIQPDLNPITIASSGLTGILTVLVLLIIVFAPTLGFILCTATDSIGEILSPAAWRGLVANHKEDLVVFYASMMGGVITFWLLYFFPLIVTTILAFYINEGLGTTLTLFFLSLPVLMAPILLGRICGAFVYGMTEHHEYELESNVPAQASVSVASGSVVNEDSESTQQAADSRVNSPTAANTMTQQGTTALTDAEKEKLGATLNLDATERAARETKPASYGPGEDTSINALLKKIENVTDLALKNSVLLAENRFKSFPDDPFAAAEISLLALRTGEVEATLKSMEVSISLALQHEVNKLAMRLLVSAGKEKFKIDLAGSDWVKLADLFRRASHYRVAAGCYNAAGKLSVEVLQNLLEDANKKGKESEADWLKAVLEKKGS